MKKMLTYRDLSVALRMRPLKNYVFSTLLYEMESWTLKIESIKKLQAFEM